MILFKERKLLVNLYYRWLEEDPDIKPDDSPLNLVTFLSHLLDEDKVRELLEKEFPEEAYHYGKR